MKKEKFDEGDELLNSLVREIKPIMKKYGKVGFILMADREYTITATFNHDRAMLFDIGAMGMNVERFREFLHSGATPMECEKVVEHAMFVIRNLNTMAARMMQTMNEVTESMLRYPGMEEKAQEILKSTEAYKDVFINRGEH